MLHYLRFARFYKETKQNISSGKHIKRQVLVSTWRIYEKLISLSLLYTHQQNPPTPAICFEIWQKALIVQIYLLAGAPKSMHSLQTWTCSVPGLEKIPVFLVHSIVFRKTHHSMHYMNLPDSTSTLNQNKCIAVKSTRHVWASYFQMIFLWTSNKTEVYIKYTLRIFSFFWGQSTSKFLCPRRYWHNPLWLDSERGANRQLLW